MEAQKPHAGDEWRTNRHKVILIAGDADLLYEQVMVYLKAF
jgi:hypothetical protein